MAQLILYGLSLVLTMQTAAAKQHSPSSPPIAPSATAPNHAPQNPPKEDNLLSGPDVKEVSKPPSIVNRSFDGTVEIVPEPDAAAIRLLALNEGQASRLNSVVAERTRIFDECVAKNYGLILELGSFHEWNNIEAVRELQRKVGEAFAPIIREPSTYDSMKPLLSPAQNDEVRRMVQEYRVAMVEDIRRQLGKDATQQQIGSRARLEVFGVMVRQSIERQIGMAQDAFEEIANALDLTAEQKTKAQAIFQPLGVKQFQRIDTPEDRIAAFREFRKILTAEQRAKLLEIIVDHWQESKKETEDATKSPQMPE